EDGIRDDLVTGVQTCALPISRRWSLSHYHYLYHRPYGSPEIGEQPAPVTEVAVAEDGRRVALTLAELVPFEIYELHARDIVDGEIGRASCRGREWMVGGGRMS